MAKHQYLISKIQTKILTEDSIRSIRDHFLISFCIWQFKKCNPPPEYIFPAFQYEYKR